MKAIPVAVRERILKLHDQGRSTAEFAASFGYCVAAVRRVRQRFKERGSLEPQTHRCGRKTLLTDARKARPLALPARRPEATLAELAAPFKRPTSTLDLRLTRLGWRCKKRCTPASSRGRTWRPKARPGRDVQAVVSAHPDADPDDVRHTLIMLRMSPWERLERSLRRGRATPVLAR